MTTKKDDKTKSDPEGVESAVREELRAMQPEIVEEIREGLSGESAEKFESVTRDIAEIKRQLSEKQRKGDKPDDDGVVDLEERLEEAEKKQGELAEQVRILQAKPTVPAGEGKPEANWGGRFLHVTDELKRFMRGYYLPDFNEQETVGRAVDTTLFATGGQLPVAVADTFIDFIISQQLTLGLIQTRRMNSPQGRTDELRVSSRKTRKAVEGTAPSGDAGVTTKSRTMTTVETILPEDLTLTFLEDNIERAGAEGHIARVIGLAFGNDANDLAWNGDEASSDPFLSINDGFLKLLQNSQDPDVTDEDLSSSPPATNSAALQRVFQALDDRFLGRTDLGFFTSVRFGQKYADEVSKRETGLGDQILINGLPALRYFGIRVLPETHIASAANRIVLTALANLFYGIQRSFRVDSEWVPRKRIVEYTISARTDYEYATGEAVVNGHDVPAALN